MTKKITVSIPQDLYQEVLSIYEGYPTPFSRIVRIALEKLVAQNTDERKTIMSHKDEIQPQNRHF